MINTRKDFSGILLGLLMLFALTNMCYGQGVIPKELYTATGIPDSLKDEANSVLRYSNDDITITGPGKATVKHHSLITILNENGDNEAVVEYNYNKKYDTYSFIDVHVYNADGLMIKKYHKSDFYDGAEIDNETIVSDERFLGLKHTVASYPETIEVEYEEDVSSFINPDSWYMQGIDQSVQNETYKISAKPEVGFRYYNKNTLVKPVKTSANDFDVYSWSVSNVKALKKEVGVLPVAIMPAVLFGTTQFNCYGYPGSLDSWQNYGKWVYALNKDVCTLSPQRVAEIQKMTDSIKSDKDKAKFLYKYLQQNTRYVSIQLGIGGYKPFDANFVDTKKYGDCKALANYMYALLKAVNIPSYWAVVTAGFNEEPSLIDFPHNNFNHEILCIPFKNDTTWLDCTMTTREFGQPGPFTENRNALLITEDGGRLINTPKSTAQENQFNSEVHLTLDSVGGAKAKVKIFSTGEYREEYIYHASLKQDEQKERLLHQLNIKQASAFDINYAGDSNGVKEMDLNLEYDRFCDIAAGDKMFYHPHVFDLSTVTVPIIEHRKNDFYFDYPMQRSCVTTIDLPAGFTIETLPANQSLKFTYGNYEVNYTYDAVKNQVISTAKFNLNNHVIPAAKYNEMQEYLDAVAKAQNKKLVIRRKA